MSAQGAAGAIGEPGGAGRNGALRGRRRILWGPWLVILVAWPATLLGWYYITLVADPSWLRDRFLFDYLVTMLVVDSILCVAVMQRVTRRVRAMLRLTGPPDLATARVAWLEALHLPTRTAWLVSGLVALTTLPVTLYLLTRGEYMLTLHGWTAALVVGACELTLLFPLVQATTLPFLRHLKTLHPELRIREPGTPAPPLRAYFALSLTAVAAVATLLVGRLIHLLDNPAPAPLEPVPEAAAIALAAVSLATMLGGIGFQLYLAVLVPQRALARAMVRFASGDAGTRVGLLHVGEIGLLAEHFDDMVASLSASREALAEREAQLRHAQRFETMGAMAAAFAHEVANPLAGIRMNLKVAADVLREEAGRGDAAPLREAGSMLRGARDAAEQMAALLQELRSFGRRDGDERAPCDVSAVLELALRIAGPELRRVGRVERAYKAAPPVQGNPHRLTQVFVNLLLNAAQAIPPGCEGRFRVGAGPVDGGVEAWVGDNGVGVPETLRERIFEAMFTTRPDGQGSGLGLHVSRKIVEEHGGRIWLDADAESGATFRVFLPAIRR